MERTRVITVESLADLSRFAEEFLRENPQGAIVGLSGDLGAGKTAFVRKIVEILSAKAKRTLPRVTSPSFVIHQSYDKIQPPVDHFDLYRLDPATPDMLTELGYGETVDRALERQGFVFVEWPERVSDSSLLRLNLSLRFSIDGPDKRVLHLTELQ